MADKAIPQEVCQVIGVTPAEVLDWAELDDQIVVVLIAGQKYRIAKDDIKTPPAKTPETEDKAPAKKETKSEDKPAAKK